MTPTARGEVSRLPVDPGVGTSLGPRPADGRPTRTRRNQTLLLALGCGGALGAMTRYAIALAMPAAPGRFPWGTFTINVTGSFVLGLLLILLLERFPRARLARPALGTGFLGAYTTFSTYMVDAVRLVREGRPETAAVYVVASLLAGLVAVWLGMAVGRAATRVDRWLQAGDR